MNDQNIVPQHPDEKATGDYSGRNHDKTDQGPIEATLTWSEHDRLLRKFQQNQNLRGQALQLASARSYSFNETIKLAREYLSFLSGDPTPTVEESPESIAQRNYQEGFDEGQRVNQSASSEDLYNNYRIGAEDRQKLVLERVREVLRDEYESFETDQTVTVTQAYNRIKHLLNTTVWGF